MGWAAPTAQLVEGPVVPTMPGKVKPCVGYPAGEGDEVWLGGALVVVVGKSQPGMPRPCGIKGTGMADGKGPVGPVRAAPPTIPLSWPGGKPLGQVRIPLLGLTEETR